MDHARETLPRDAGNLVIYDTRSRSKQPFQTIEPGQVRMYVCGVTVYDDAHIGHAMSVMVFDMIRRYLEYRGYVVRHAQNFTDIDDKIITRANREGINPNDLTGRLISNWLSETLALNVLPATVYPRATQELPAIIAMIEGLIDRGHAYPVEGDVYYRVRSFPGYGKLSHRDPDDLRSGARIDVDERKDDPLDFALWKAVKPGEPSWPSPFGEGRPGWHIECSAMCTTHLGGFVDIHGGGTDLIFPHHENEIAQSEAFLGGEPFARYWLHNGMLRFGGEKMSKSLGNMVTVRSLLDRGLGDAFRLMVLQSHYRAPLTYSEEALAGAERGLERLRTAAGGGGAVGRPDTTAPALGDALAGQTADTWRRFFIAMDDDFDTPAAIAALFDLARSINREAASSPTSASLVAARTTLGDLMGVLGFDPARPTSTAGADASPFIDLLVTIRETMRKERHWALADQIRDGLADRGVTLEDGPAGTTWRATSGPS
ncbi:MAG: cysteine--tRNA ligase [Chloroflexia bacterium]|nr:cysteine--tRNA ligase [Chloroflexia bacterium]